MQSNGESQYCIMKRWGESGIDLVTWCDSLRDETRRSLWHFWKYTSSTIYNRSRNCQIDQALVLKNGIFCKLFLLTAIKDPKSTFTLIKGRPDRTGEGRQGENYSFDEENMRRGFLCFMGRVTWYNMWWHSPVTFGDPTLWLVDRDHVTQNWPLIGLASDWLSADSA